ncbi:AMP-binding protein [Kitasatospora sp. NPDC002227]|uniref:AMP-binding protein n=1 Tax=Kitasatospora sp. NPDC002227 TaxID=3154773 RepID=UPI00331A5E88
MHALRLGPSPAFLDGTERVPAATTAAGLAAAATAFDAPAKALVAVLTGRDLPGVLAYLAALGLGHAALLREHPGIAARDALLTAYQPEFVLDGGTGPVPAGYRASGELLGARVLARTAVPRSPVHPELAVLITTSGTLGRPKAVRLSYANLAANAESVVTALGLGPADLGITSLPLDHSFGLSVLNTHLAVGAPVVLSRLSPTARRFWQLCARAGVTDLGAVPITYRLLHSTGWRPAGLPALRLAYQAGGPLEPGLARHFGELMAEHGGGFCPMYGATEATARMAYLPPAELMEHLGSVGRAVPGGRLRLHEPDRDGVGEIVYQGPNVMLGYAEHRADLAEGRTHGDVLHTGDLGRLERGMLYVLGRKDRQLKLYGKRLRPEEIEQRLAVAGPAAVVAAAPDTAVVFVEGDRERFRAAWLDVLRILELPAESLPLREVAGLPRTASGKVDLGRLRMLCHV